jgi:hypothetical protein
VSSEEEEEEEEEEEPGQDNGEEIDVETVLAEPEEQKENVHYQPPDLEPPAEEEEPAPPPTAAGGPGGQSIGVTCRDRFTAVHHSPGTRPESAIKYIVIHSTEGDTAAGAASWFANPESEGSAHLVVDDRECYRTLANKLIPWGAPGTNRTGFHIEHAGHANWPRQKWMSHPQTLRRGAFKAAFHAVKFGIPLRLLSVSDLRQGRSGFVTHATATKAFNPGGHTDPGAGFPLDHYMQLVKRFVGEIQNVN